MKIKKLEIVGFKSFVDRTVVNFDHDVTGIVGPNGCGKSNVVDAIKWVMGEQSPSRLRGKAMDDVIFNGSENRGPHSFAEVSLTFDNTAGLAPPDYRDYAEITVTRALDRSGRSDYRINKTPVRLMDVTNLFLGTGVGRRAYSIIEQGRVGFIVSSKAADRRSMIEEAAGITKFKVRKRAAERKMDQTRQNLLRVGDIVRELERSLASLKRQAQKAERYRKYRDELRELELHDASHRYLELFHTIRVVKRDRDAAEASDAGARAGLRMREAELEAERLDAQRLSSEVDGATNIAYERDNEVRLLEANAQSLSDRLATLHANEARAERELQELRGQRDELTKERDALIVALEDLEKAEAEASGALETEQSELERRRHAIAEAERAVVNARARVGDCDKRIARAEAVLGGFARRREEARQRIERLAQDIDSLKSRQVELRQEHETVEARLRGLRSGSQQTAARRTEIEEELRAFRAEIKDSDQNVNRLREEVAQKRSRLRSLQELQQRFEGVGAGTRALMTRSDAEAKGTLGLVLDRIVCPPEMTNALSGALGEALQHVVVEDLSAGVDAISFLMESEAGRATMISRAGQSVAPTLFDTALTQEGVVGRLLDHVSPREEADARVVEALLQNVLVVRTLSDARHLHESGVKATIVTLQGERITPAGALSGGSGEDPTAHLLEMKRESSELTEVVSDLETRLEQAVARHGELRRGIAERQAAIDSARDEAHGAEIATVKAEKDIRRLEQELQQSQEREQRLASEHEELTHASAMAGDEEREARSEIEDAKETRAAAQSELEVAEAIFTERKASFDEQLAVVTEVRVRAAKAQERAQSDRNALERLSRSTAELDAREKRLDEEIMRCAHGQGATAAAIMLERDKLSTAVTTAMEAHAHLGSLREQSEAARNALGESEAALKRVRQELDMVSSQLGELTLRDRELEMEMTHLMEQVEERHRVDVRDVVYDYHARAMPDEEMRQRLVELRRLLERMGAVNLTAIEEYEENSARYEHLKGQQEDLEEGLKKLDKAIREMNRESKRMFKEAFVAVNERFKRMYPELFRGGKAELKLTDPSNMLESGVDIIAQPPGKKLGSLELMSGGEKALTAVALIFAIFDYKPSPFCILDEVDAPLDEANIARYAQAIRQMTSRSQFIIITHSKRTMEFTDVLYGVTMEQPGVSKLVSVELKGESQAMKTGGARVA